jgi:D-alanyl-D-alanine carboxypeptidase
MRRQGRKRLGLLITLLAGLTFAHSPAGYAHSASDDRLVRAMEELVERPGGPPGVAAMIRRPGGTRFLTAGVANLDSGRHIRPTDHMRIASTSKAFSGAVALSLVQSGDLALDDHVGDLLPSMPPDWQPVTLAQLMQHTSGIPSYTDDTDFRVYFGNHLHGGSTPEELLEWVADDDMTFAPPGTDYAYSNSDNIIIALMAEAATGDSYEDLIRDRVVNPLGLHRTAMPPSFALPPPRLRGYDMGPPIEDVTTCCSIAFVWASGGLYSTPRDLLRFARGYIGAELFDPQLQDQQLEWFDGGSSEPPGPGHNSAGLSVFRYETSCGTVLGHTGNFPGYTQLFAATRNGKRALTVSASTQLSDTEHPEVFEELRRVDKLAVCAAFAG